MPSTTTFATAWRWAVPLALSAVAAATWTQPALACGACISPTLETGPNQLVVQDAERVLFLRDPLTKVSTVWVEVRYAGLAKDFAWVLPVPKLPKVGVGTVAVLDALDQSMAARVRLRTDPPENCRDPAIGCASFKPGWSADGAAALDAAALGDTAYSDTGSGGVEVLASGATGPYNYVVIKGAEVEALYKWLNDHGYATPDKAKPILASHVAKGDLFVAVKLQNGQGVGAIRPITLTMDDAEPCVPLRLTSIAAKDDMTVVVTLGGPGRAIVKNHLDVQLNPLRLQALAGPVLACPAVAGGPSLCRVPGNYAQVVAAAVDEAGGNAFVTEYAQPGSATGSLQWIPAGTPAALSGVGNYLQLGQLRATGGLPVTQEVADTLDEALGLSSYATGTTALQVLGNLRGCAKYWQNTMVDYQNCPVPVAPEKFTHDALTAQPVNGAKAADVVQKQLVDPVAEVAAHLAKATTVTRMVMRISPDEMDRDPVFAFNKGLPPVANTAELRTNKVCLSGWTYGWPEAVRLTWPELGSWVVDAGTSVPPRFAQTPAADKIQLLDEAGDALEVAPVQVPVISSAIAGAKPGQPQLPKDFVAQPAQAWPVPPSDPLVTTAGVWYAPPGCNPKAGWLSGSPPPLGAAVGASDGGSVPNVDAQGGWGDLASADTAGAAAKPAAAKADSGCAAGTASATARGTWPLAALLAALVVARWRSRRSALTFP
ncbi:MAG: DUF2330 domain-containing protein [Deltaproteobacteria bacterium]|nr:DUF2330 domain-containing protein [Deltaproteobacteria bacterium]